MIKFISYFMNVMFYVEAWRWTHLYTELSHHLPPWRRCLVRRRRAAEADTAPILCGREKLNLGREIRYTVDKYPTSQCNLVINTSHTCTTCKNAGLKFLCTPMILYTNTIILIWSEITYFNLLYLFSLCIVFSYKVSLFRNKIMIANLVKRDDVLSRLFWVLSFSYNQIRYQSLWNLMLRPINLCKSQTRYVYGSIHSLQF